MLVPGLYGLLGRVFARLDPGSRMRRMLVREQMISGWAAASRADWKLVEIRYAADLVYEFSPEMVSLGLPARVEGREEWMSAIAEFQAAWEEVHYVLHFILDLGDTLLTLGRARARGRASGAELEFDYAQLIESSDGVASRERDYTDWRQVLTIVDLEPEVLERLEALPPGGILEVG